MLLAGKTSPQLVEVADLSEGHTTFAGLRQRLRQRHGGARKGKMNVICVFSREAVLLPQDACEGRYNRRWLLLNCHGYGSSVTVTATFGLVGAAQATQRVIA